MQTTPLLELCAVTKRFGAFTAVQDVALQVARGEIVGLIGPNGAGKTTLLSMLVGMFTPTAGEILLDGQCFTAEAQHIKRQIGFVPDSQEVIPFLTAWEYLEFVRCVYDLPLTVQAQTKDLLHLLQIDQKMHQMLDTFSHGQRKKIQFVAALMHQPDLLILDEPFSGLDPEMVVHTRQLVRGLRDRGHGIFLSSHDLQMVSGLCDRVVLMHRGQILADGQPEALLFAHGGHSLEDLFLRLLGHTEGVEEVSRVLAHY